MCISLLDALKEQDEEIIQGRFVLNETLTVKLDMNLRKVTIEFGNRSHTRYNIPDNVRMYLSDLKYLVTATLLKD